MAGTVLENQISLTQIEDDTETLSERNKFLIKRLREFRTIEADIRVQERLMRGVGLLHEPRITSAPPVVDRMQELATIELSPREKELVDTLRRYVSLADFAKYDEDTGRITLTYASAERVTRALKRLDDRHIDPADRDRLQAVQGLLARHIGEEYVHLTDTEKVADIRLKERAKAEAKYRVLCERRDIIAEALAMMERWRPRWHALLWHRYVMDESRDKVCILLARDGVPLTLKEYRGEREKALRQFDKWTQGLT
ncbi:MAG: hypothetical protein K6T83_20460 [Alicyclobacillus sp.]|nr:hypothetical protein [Alicyclobacillus sp.]